MSSGHVTVLVFVCCYSVLPKPQSIASQWWGRIISAALLLADYAAFSVIICGTYSNHNAQIIIIKKYLNILMWVNLRFCHAAPDCIVFFRAYPCWRCVPQQSCSESNWPPPVSEAVLFPVWFSSTFRLVSQVKLSPAVTRESRQTSGSCWAFRSACNSLQLQQR